MTAQATATRSATARSRPARVRVLRTAADVDAARDAWAATGVRGLDADPDYLLEVVRSRDEALAPHVLLLERDGRPEGILVGRLEDRVLAARLGYATPYRPRLRCITVVSGGDAGPPEAMRELVRALLAQLRAGEAQAALLHRVDIASALFAEAQAQAPAPCRQRFLAPTRHWANDLPGTFDELQASFPKSLRGNIRRDGRKLEAALGDRIRIERLSDLADFDRIVDDVEAVARRTYQRGLGGGFDAVADGPLTWLALAKGWLVAWIMYLDGAPVAFELGHVHHGTFHSAAKGFDPDHGRHGVGTYLQMRMLRDLCADPEVATVDFGFGDADYKRRCASRCWEEVDLAIHAPAPGPLAVGAARNAVAGLDLLARRVAGPDRIARVKRRWRDARTPGRPGAGGRRPTPSPRPR